MPHPIGACTFSAVICAALAAAPLGAQPEPIVLGRPAGPRFEVASVKPSDREEAMRLGRGIKRDPARIDIRYWSIKQIILRAYGLWPSQLSGPDWVDSQRFDISAKIPVGAKADDLPGMLQWLLLERFGLAAHIEARTMPTFALVLAKGGAKMKPAAADAGAPEDRAGLGRIERAGRVLDSLWGDGAELGLKTMSVDGTNVRLEFTRMPMEALVQLLSSYLRMPVSDQTGLGGNYSATLEFSLADTIAVAQAESAGSGLDSASAPFGTSLFAMVQRLGLKLEPRKAPVPVLVVDHLERVPTAN
jgi:uncharacterized protein (TIGR03435 family)